MSQWWSWALTIVGVTGLYFAGKKKAFGWGIGIAAQFLWIAYAIATQQWGFILGSIAYGSVYTKNFISWRRSDKRVFKPQPIRPAVRVEYHVPKHRAYTPPPLVDPVVEPFIPTDYEG